MASLNGILGIKKGMLRTFNEAGQAVAATVIEAGPCVVLQKKTVAKEGYNAIQLGFKAKAIKKMILPAQGHARKAGAESGFTYIKEFRVSNPDAYTLGQVISLQDIEFRQIVDVIGVSKGCGFQGTVKKYGFNRGRMSHGGKHHREMGSTGMCTYPSRVIKGKRMPSRMGGEQITLKNSMVLDVRPQENLLIVKGSVPGPNNRLVQVKCK